MKKLIIVFFIALFPNLLFSNAYIDSTLDEQNKLLEDIKNDFISISLSAETLKNENNNLTLEKANLMKLCEQSEIKINKLEENIISLKSALSSNKEDESVILYELGNMFEELENYKEYIASVKRKLRNVSVFVNIAIPLCTIPIACNGIYNIAKGDELVGKINLYTSLGLFVGLECVYQGGKFIFKVW